MISAARIDWHHGWQTAKRVMWVVLLAGAFLMYYLLHMMNEALKLL
jgi:hypothetical protein